MLHFEHHKVHRVGWLRASVLGANDGIVSVASLLVGVAAANATRHGVLLAGVAGLVAGALSMAAGEYVSVSSQADTERADIELERSELAKHPERELEELTEIYVQRGLDADLARQVAEQLTSRDALAAHMRDELGLTEAMSARPIQAALASAASFAVGAGMPLIAAWFSPVRSIILVTVVASVVLLALLGGISAHTGGAGILRAVARVTFWGLVAMGVTAAVGSIFGVSA